MGETMKLSHTDQVVTFDRFFCATEKGLRYALVAVYGFEDGRDASAHAFLYGWENWHRLQGMTNPAGYLYRVGQTWGRRNGRSADMFPTVNVHHDPWVEPRLPQALGTLPEKQRVAVVLRHGADWSYDQIAEFLDSSPTSVRKNVERALTRLRVALEVSHES